MPHFARTDEQRLLADSLARLVTGVQPFEPRGRRRAGWEINRTLWSALAEAGMIGAAFPESHGGFAGDARTISVVMAELGSSLALGPYIECAVIAGRLLQGCTNDDITQKEIESIMGGKHIAILAHSTTGISSQPTVQALRCGNETRLSGKVLCVRYGAMADALLVPAISEAGAACIFRVARNSPGLLLQDYRLIDGSCAADIDFHSVAADDPLPLGTDVRQALVDALEWGVLAGVAETVGIVTALNSATFAYLMTRRQFGVEIGSFQALQHRAADMHIAAEEALTLADFTIEAFTPEIHANRSALVSAAKVVADEAGRRIGSESIQLHGAMGVSDELIVSHHARRLIAVRHTYGAVDIHHARFRTTSGSTHE